MFLYIITGQKKEFWKVYFQNMNLIYKMWILMIKRGLRLRSFYVKKYGRLVGTFLVISHMRLIRFKMPFRYYKSIEGFILRNILVISLMGLVIFGIYIEFTEIKFWFVNACPDPKEVIYPDDYYPYAIFLVTSIIGLVQLGLVFVSKTIRFMLSEYKYQLIVLNLVNLFVLITVHCTVAHEGLFYVWWLPESYEMISFSNEEEVFMSYWAGELKYYWNQFQLNEGLLNLRFIKEWSYIIMYKVLQF